MTRFVVCLAGMVALTLLTAHAEDKKNDPPKSDTPSSVPGSDDLSGVNIRQLLKDGGFGEDSWSSSLHDYVRFGTLKAYEAYRIGDQFDKLEIEKAAVKHRDQLRLRTFTIDKLPVVIRVPSDVETEGLQAELALPMRVRGDREFFQEPMSKFTGLVSTIRPSELNPWFQAFLTKDGKLRPCSAAEAVQVKQLQGVLYHPEKGPTTLTIVLKSPLDTLKTIARNPNDYSVRIEFTKLRYDRPATWGWFRQDSYLDENRDTQRLLDKHDRQEDATQPLYFVTESLAGDKQKVPQIVQADLKSLAVVDKAGKVVGGYNLKP